MSDSLVQKPDIKIKGSFTSDCVNPVLMLMLQVIIAINCLPLLELVCIMHT